MDKFKDIFNNPETWFIQAWEMFEASKANFEAFRNCRQISTEKDHHRRNGLMKATKLCLSLAAENGLKGAYIYTSKPEFNSNKISSTHFHKKSHDLNDLAARLELSLNEEDHKLLKRLSSFIIWAAKYKTPLTSNQWEKFKGEDMIKYPSDFNIVEQLIEQLQLKSGYTATHGWPSRN